MDKVKYCISKITIPLKIKWNVVEEAWTQTIFVSLTYNYWLPIIMINKQEIGSESQLLVI